MLAGNKRTLHFSATALSAIALIPFVTLITAWGMPDKGSLIHLLDTVLMGYVASSLMLAIGVGVLSCVLGVSTAWCVTRYHLPARGFLSYALMLPLAVPAYILAMLYGTWLEGAGPLQQWLITLGIQTTPYEFIRSLPGAIIILSLALYPYIYALTRTALLAQPASLYESARMLGRSRTQLFWHVTLPSLRPTIAAGVALVIMEALADFGVSSLYGVQTLTTGIYRTWFGMFDPIAAAKLAGMLVLCVLAALAMEQRSRKYKRYDMMNSGRSLERLTLSPLRRWLITCFCFLPVLLGFALPVIQLALWALRASPDAARLAQDIYHTLLVAGWTAVLAVLITLIFGYALRGQAPRWLAALVRIATLGYAIPGTVIAVALFLPLIAFDKFVITLWRDFTGESIGLIMTGTIGAMVLACTIRFLALAHGSVGNALEHVSPTMDEAAASLGASRWHMVLRVHWPLLRPGCLFALLIVFTDTIKELPASLMLRPFNVNTLAIRTYELASDSRTVEAALPALALVGISAIVLVVVLHTGRARETTLKKDAWQTYASAT